jgi:exonuclease VII small subunit
MKAKQLEARCAEIEEEISRLEQEIAELEGGFGSYSTAEEYRQAAEQAATKRAAIDRLTAEWDEATQLLA